MHAKVKPDVRWNTVTACGGTQFNKRAFVPVRPGFEAEAEASAMLEVIEDYTEVDEFVLAADEASVEEAEELVAFDAPTLEELRAEAKDRGILGWHNMKYETLVTRLAEEDA